MQQTFRDDSLVPQKVHLPVFWGLQLSCHHHHYHPLLLYMMIFHLILCFCRLTNKQIERERSFIKLKES